MLAWPILPEKTKPILKTGLAMKACSYQDEFFDKLDVISLKGHGLSIGKCSSLGSRSSEASLLDCIEEK